MGQIRFMNQGMIVHVDRTHGILFEQQSTIELCINQIVETEAQEEKAQILKNTIILEMNDSIRENLLFYQLEATQIDLLAKGWEHLDFQSKVDQLCLKDQYLVSLFCGVRSKVSVTDLDLKALDDEAIRSLFIDVIQLQQQFVMYYLFLFSDAVLGRYYQTLFTYITANKQLIPLKYI